MHVILQAKGSFEINDIENPSKIEITYGTDGQPSTYTVTKGGVIADYPAATYHIAIMGG